MLIFKNIVNIFRETYTPEHICVYRPVGMAEIDRTPAAQEALQKEWDSLRIKLVWDEHHPRAWDDG